jgi:AraC-like DNA-binding protein
MMYENNFQNREELTEVNVSSCRYKTKSARGFPPHCHSFFEMDYSVKGDRLATLHGKSFFLPEGSLYFVPILAAHATTNTASYTENIIIQFSREFLYTNAKTLPRTSIIVPEGELAEKGYIIPKKDSHILNCLEQMAEICPLRCVNDWDVKIRVNENELARLQSCKDEYLKFLFPFTYTPSIEWTMNGLTMELIASLFEEHQLGIAADMGDPKDAIRIQPVLNQLIAHPETKLSLHKAADIACMSYSNFSCTFKKLIGYNYVDYCNIARVRYAEELLQYSKFSVTQISEQLNFGCINYFNRIFKKYNGDTPLHYRKKIQS